MDKNYISTEEIVEYIADDIDIKWAPLFYAPGHVAKNPSNFINWMSNLSWLSYEINNIVINITLPKKRRKKIKNLDDLLETFNDIIIRY